MTAYYNEINKYAAQWLRNLIEAGHIAKGIVDERSIEDVKPSDLTGFNQCHFFAGIGGWPLALRIAGWPDDKPVWTGSCPCQPFSKAGQGAGSSDKRHLWPSWFHLITQCRPSAIFAEQVDAAIKFGWLDLVHGDLEGCGYAVTSVSIPAASIGAPHIRQRIWTVAKSNLHEYSTTKPAGDREQAVEETKQRSDQSESREFSRTSDLSVVGVGDSNEQGSQGREVPSQSTSKLLTWPPSVACEWIECRDGKKRAVKPGVFPLADGLPGRMEQLRAYGNAIVPQVAAQIIRGFL